MLAYVADTVGCVYPKPVKPADELQNVIKYFEEQGKDEYVLIHTANAYDEDQNYVSPVYGQYSADDGSDCFGKNPGYDGLYEYQFTKRYTVMDRLISMSAKTLPELIDKMQEYGIKGTLNIAFYNNYRCEGRFCTKRFKILLQ